MESQIAETPLLVEAGIHVPTFLVGCILFLIAKVYFFWKPKKPNYHYLHGSALLTLGWATPQPLGLGLLLLGLIDLGMAYRYQRALRKTEMLEEPTSMPEAAFQTERAAPTQEA